jgi:ribosome-associated protein
VIVHLFRPEVRSFYNLERMWAFGDESAATASPSNPPAASPGA